MVDPRRPGSLERPSDGRVRRARHRDARSHRLRPASRRPQRQLRQLDSEPRAAARGAARVDEGRRGPGARAGLLRRASRRSGREERAIARRASPTIPRGCSQTFGVAAPEQAFPRLQDALQYPTLNVRGLTSAHVGAGARTIIPDRATAAIDIRLVKETLAADLVEKVRAHVRAQGFHLVDGEPDDDDAGGSTPSSRRSSPPGRRRRRSGHCPPIRTRAALPRASNAGSANRPCGCARSEAPSRSRRSSKRSGFPAHRGADRQLRQQPARREREPAARDTCSRRSRSSRQFCGVDGAWPFHFVRSVRLQADPLRSG